MFGLLAGVRDNSIKTIKPRTNKWPSDISEKSKGYYKDTYMHSFTTYTLDEIKQNKHRFYEDIPGYEGCPVDPDFYENVMSFTEDIKKGEKLDLILGREKRNYYKDYRLLIGFDD